MQPHTTRQVQLLAAEGRQRRRRSDLSSPATNAACCGAGAGGATLFVIFATTIACLVLLQQPPVANAFPSGAPESACKDLRPGHGGEPSTGVAPFELLQDKLDVDSAGQQIKVTLTSPNKTNFKGLIVQALNERDEPIGKFLAGKGLKLLDGCSAVTHADREAKKTATLVWEAPSDVSSKTAVKFVATVVEKFDTYYVGVKSTLGSA